LEATHQYRCFLKGTSTFHVKVLQRVFIKFGNLHTLLDVYKIFEKLDLAHAHYATSTMRPPSCPRPRPPPATPTKSSHSSSGLKQCTWLHPSYLLATTIAILSTKLVSATFLSRIYFVIIVGKREIRKLFVLPSSRNGSNFDYHNKICQHLLLPLNQKPRHLSLPLKLSPPKVILVRMLRRRRTILTRGRCFKPMLLKLKLYKMKSNH
jgi:hypothetical protein